MNKYLLKTCCFLFITSIGFAQTKDELKYKERAAEVKQEIAQNTDKAFTVTDIPEKYKNESAVIIARSFEVTNSAKRRFKMVTIFGGSVKQYSYFTTLRERVSIQDKSALEEFSTLNYKKVVDNSVRVYFSKLVNTSKTYIGARIIKQGGKTIDINPGEEEVLTQNNDKAKEGKIAIPDLQIGDILDYYIRIEELMEDRTEVRGPDVFFLRDDYPILYYNVKYFLDKNCAADVMSMNGVKELEVSRSDDRDIILEFTERDLPKKSSTFWTSQSRQVPYHIIRYGFPAPGILAHAGMVKTGPFTYKYKMDLKEMFVYSGSRGGIDFSPKKSLEDYYGGRKEVKNLPPDSIVNYLYNYYHWLAYGSFTNMNVSNERNYNDMNWFRLSLAFSEILTQYEIENDIIMVSNRYAPKISDVFSLNDFHVLVKINSGAKLKWVCFNDFFQNPGQLAAIYQGEEAIKMTRLLKGKWPNYAITEDIVLPVAKSSENVLSETSKVSFNKDNLQLITIEKEYSATGNMKQNDQKKLLLAEDVEANFAALIDKEKVTDKLAEKKKTRDKAAESQAALDKERLKQKDYFIDEIKEQYEQEPKELISYEIKSNGLSIYDSAFKYREVFTMENFVKKAGNNFILDAGKLMGVYKKTDEKERTRTLDIYMPSARTLVYTFNISIPEGYSVKGIDEMNKKVENETASFVSTAKLNGNDVAITVIRTYHHNFEPAANWSKLLEVMDAASDFTGMKLLLEKKK